MNTNMNLKWVNHLSIMTMMDIKFDPKILISSPISNIHVIVGSSYSVINLIGSSIGNLIKLENKLNIV